MQVDGTAGEPSHGRWKLRLQKKLEGKLRLAHTGLTRHFREAARVDARAKAPIQDLTSKREPSRVPPVVEKREHRPRGPPSILDVSR